MATPAAILSILVQAQGLQKTASQVRRLDTDLDKVGKTGTRSGSAIKKMGGVVAGVVAFDTLRRGVGLAVSEFEEARKVGAQTNAVLKSTGGVANVTSKNVNDLAAALSKKAGIDDEVIQSGENMLLTFRGIRNETGKGNDIFNQATKAALDMSVALGTDMKGSALQLGKALNDPSKGLSRLTRSGVTFTDQQKKQIETLQKSGDTLGAQKIILHELSKEFGGSAAAAATPLDKLKVAGLNLAEAAGSVLVPAIDKAARFLTTLINQMIEGKSVGGALVSVFRTTGEVVGTVITAVSGLVGWFKQHKTVTAALTSAVASLTAAFVAYKAALLATVALQAALAAASFVQVFVKAAVATDVLTASMIALDTAVGLNPFVIAAVALAALVAGVVVAYKESETFRKIINTAWAMIKSFAGWLVTAGVAAFTAVKNAVVAAWGSVKRATSDTFSWLRGAVRDVAGFLKDRWENIKSAVAAYWSLYRTLIISPIRSAFDWLRGAVGSVAGFLKDRWENIKSAASTAWQAVKTVIVNPVRNAIDAVKDVIGHGGKNASGLIGWLANAWDTIKDGVGSFAAHIKDAVVGAFKGAVNSVIGFVNKIIDVINVIPGVPNIKHIKGLAEGGVHAASATAQGFARGGAFAKTGGIVNKPMTFMGEEAPRHPEFVIPTNPAYRGRAQKLLAAAGAVIGGGVGIGSQGMNGQQTAFKIGGVFGGGIDTILDLVADGGKALIGKLPNPGEMLPGWLHGLGSWTIEHVKKWITGKIGGLLGGPGGDWANVPPDGRIAAMVAMANRLDMMDIPYGPQGHAGWPINQAGEDCSSTVSKVLHAAGYLSSVLTTVGLPGALAHGSGQFVTVHDRALAGNAGHTVIQIGSKVFGTSNSNPGGGPGWINPGSGYLSTLPTKLHPAGLAMGGMFGGLPFLGTYHTGGVAPREGFAHVARGETMTPAGMTPVIYADIYIGGEKIDEKVQVQIRERDRQSSRTYRAGVSR